MKRNKKHRFSEDDLRTDGLSAKAFSEWLEGEFDLKGDAGMEAAMAAVEAEKGDGELSRLTDETFDYFVLRHNHSLVLVEPKVKKEGVAKRLQQQHSC